MKPNFRRSTRKGATRHLLLANCGRARGVSEVELEQLLQPYSPEIIYLGDQVFSNVTFRSEEEAEAAREGLANVEVKGRPLAVYFAELVLPPVIPDLNFALDFDHQIPGLFVYPEFVSRESETALLETIQARPWDATVKRRVQHYGYAFNYDFLGIDRNQPLGPLPEFCRDLVDAFMELPCITTEPDQLTINEYLPGVGIAFHCDTHSMFEDELTVLSIGSSIVLEFRKGDERYPLVIPARSLLVMTDAARYGWKHGIASRTTDPVPASKDFVSRETRLSLTFRTIRHRPCACAWPEECDTQNPASLQLPTRNNFKGDS